MGGGPASTVVELISAKAPNAPTAITRLSFDSPSQMVIGWTPPTDDGGSPDTIDYLLYSDNGEGAGYSLLASTTSQATSFLVDVITTKTYYFKVKAFNEVGISGYSNPNSGFLAGAVPSVPLDLTLVSQSQFQIKFSWTVPTNLGGIPLASYRIYWDYGNLGTSVTSLFVLAGMKVPSELLYTQSSNIVTG